MARSCCCNSITCAYVVQWFSFISVHAYHIYIIFCISYLIISSFVYLIHLCLIDSYLIYSCSVDLYQRTKYIEMNMNDCSPMMHYGGSDWDNSTSHNCCNSSCDLSLADGVKEFYVVLGDKVFEICILI